MICFLIPLMLLADTSLQHVSKPVFDTTRGHYDEVFQLTITSATPGASIRITTDGSVPSDNPPNGLLFQALDADTPPGAVITVATTMSVRAMAFREGFKSSKVKTHSYVFAEDVLKQGAPAHKFTAWGHSGADWEMDPDIVKHSNAKSRVVPSDLKTIPALFISLPFEDFWGENGIYISGEGDPRKCSVELLNPAGDPAAPNLEKGFQVNGTVQITGGSSTRRWKTDKLSMRLKFHHELHFPVFDFPGVPSGDQATARFHTLVLDARLNDAWTHPSSRQRSLGQYVRDQYIADMQNALGGLGPHGRHVHLYVSGIYWGLYNLHERPDHHFAAQYRGGDKGDYDVIKHNLDDVVSGSKENFIRLRDLLSQQNIASPEVYMQVRRLLDVEDFARYMLLNYWAGNTDWSHQNWYASFNREDLEGRWRFHVWDAEHVLEKGSTSVLGKDDPDSPTGFHRQLMANEQYRALFADIVREQFFNGGIFEPTAAMAHYRARIEEIDPAIRAESARWGDNRKWRAYTRGGEWSAELDRVVNSWFPQRSKAVLDQLKEAGWYP